MFFSQALRRRILQVSVKPLGKILYRQPGTTNQTLGLVACRTQKAPRLLRVVAMVSVTVAAENPTEAKSAFAILKREELLVGALVHSGTPQAPTDAATLQVHVPTPQVRRASLLSEILRIGLTASAHLVAVAPATVPIPSTALPLKIRMAHANHPVVVQSTSYVSGFSRNESLCVGFQTVPVLIAGSNQNFFIFRGDSFDGTHADVSYLSCSSTDEEGPHEPIRPSA